MLRLRSILLMVLALSITEGQSSAQDSTAIFQRDVLGFLQKHCLSCHGDKVKKADLSFDTLKEEKFLLTQRKLFNNALTQVHSGEMPPKSKPRPTSQEVDAFVKAIRTTWDTADRKADPDPGRVTIRRLNRNEYNNTIRDLLGIDFSPAEDFPSDDIGHGFDNIGDVLTLSPVLMDRYLAAAESIANRAMLVDVPKPTVRAQASRWLEPAQSAEVRFRPLKKDSLHTPYRLMEGEYVFRIRAWGQKDGEEFPKVSFQLNGKEFKTYEIAAPDEKQAKIYEEKVQIPAGEHRISVVLLNPSTGEKPRTAYIEWFELRGPADMRPHSHRVIMQCDKAKPKREQTREILNRFASKAYRRPATPEEVERLIKLTEKAEAAGEKYEVGIQLAIQAVLVSPKFLFRVELDDRPTDKPHPLNEYQLASRLSYFLWATMPDQELFDLCAEGRLTANLEDQVKRMLKDPKSRTLVDYFAMQWLQLDRIRQVAPDPKLFPTFREELRSAMRKETELFLGAIIQEDLSILQMIDSDFTFINDQLGWHYNITDTLGTRNGKKPSGPGGQPIKGSNFVRVKLADGERGGLLTQASILTVTSNPTRTSPVKRGRWVLEQILGTPPPPPPPDVPELKEEGKGALTGSLRQRMEQHRQNVACAGCHARMDPLGFAFENFDAIGKFRSKDGEFNVDSSGTLPDGQNFKGPGELRKILLGKKDLFARCLTEKMLTYALGRGLEYYDKRPVDQIVTSLEKNDYRFSALVTEIVKSDPFRLRRGKDQP